MTFYCWGRNIIYGTNPIIKKELLSPSCERFSSAPPIDLSMGYYDDDDDLSMEPEYDSYVPFLHIEEGETFSVMKLLVSGEGEGDYLVRKDGTQVEVESLKNKYVLLCCFYVRSDWTNAYMRAISSVGAELREHCDFEMVMVAKLGPDWAAEWEEDAYEHFFHHFPNCCLTVPFDHKKRIDYICQSLNLHGVLPKGVFVDPSEKVPLTHMGCFWKYEVKEAFSFAREKLTTLEEDDQRLLTSSSLRRVATLLGLEPSVALSNVMGGRQMRLKDLDKYHVGLYFCCRGNLLQKLFEVYDRHKNKKPHGFEIVLVCFPDITGSEKSKFEERMIGECKSLGFSCWVLPFNNWVNRRIIRFIGDMAPVSMADRLLTVGADGQFVEPAADIVLKLWGIDAYPFSVDDLVDRQFQRLKNVKLESLLEKMPSLYVKRDQVHTRVRALDVLKGKRVLLYWGTVVEEVDYSDDPWEWYHLIKAKYGDCEVVFVHLDDIPYDSGGIGDLSWYICPYDSSFTDYLRNTISVAKLYHGRNVACSSFVAFGDDGRITSLDAVIPEVDPFADTLKADIHFKIVSIMNDRDEMMSRPLR